MKAKRFRVQNFRNIDDSGWVSLDQVTAFVGRNEAGKSTLLKALHKFNPATSEPYDPMREFPRDRYTKDYIGGGSKGGDWPVCSVTFIFGDKLKAELRSILPSDIDVPAEVIATRFYDGSLWLEFEPIVNEEPLTTKPVREALKVFASGARRLQATSAEEEENTAAKRQTMVEWTTVQDQKLETIEDLRNDAGVATLNRIRSESEAHSTPATASLVEGLQDSLGAVISQAKAGSFLPKLSETVEKALPVLIYFENYGVLDSAIYLPRFLEDIKRDPNSPRSRTINAMFKHVSLNVKEISQLGKEGAQNQTQSGNSPTEDTIAKDQRNKEERAIRLSSASNDISTRFSDWWSQRRHKIRYHADGDYFRIWVADDRRPDVEIELEARSKGFQWFFSFYLVFLVESEEGHKDAILLLDEPGLNLHPTAQHELLEFFDRLAEKNQLAYTTHSPFLIDGENLYRVRAVTEDETGHSRISADTWPADRETIFPLQAAAGYAMVKGLFQHKKNILVEGMSDYYYLHALNQQCRGKGLTSLPEDVYITPCGGTKLVGHLASLFLGQEVRPVVLLDGDDAGRVRRDALLKELYAGHEREIVMLDEALGIKDKGAEIEDILGQEIILPALNSILGKKKIQLDSKDAEGGSLPDRIKAAAARSNISLPEGWKASVALQLVSGWAQQGTALHDAVLQRANGVFSELAKRFN